MKIDFDIFLTKLLWQHFKIFNQQKHQKTKGNERCKFLYGGEDKHSWLFVLAVCIVKL